MTSLAKLAHRTASAVARQPAPSRTDQAQASPATATATATAHSTWSRRSTMYAMDGRCWQDYDAEYALPATTVTAAPVPASSADVPVPGAESALILSLDEGNVQCR